VGVVAMEREEQVARHHVAGVDLDSRSQEIRVRGALHRPRYGNGVPQRERVVISGRARPFEDAPLSVHAICLPVDPAISRATESPTASISRLDSPLPIISPCSCPLPAMSTMSRALASDTAKPIASRLSPISRAPLQPSSTIARIAAGSSPRGLS